MYPDRIDTLSGIVADIRTDVAVMKETLSYLKETMVADRQRARGLDRRVTSLEAWRWRLIGAAVAAGAAGGPLWDVVMSR